MPSAAPNPTLAEHPLLPGDDSTPPPKIKQFYVCRRDGSIWETAPRTFHPEELQSIEDIFALYGGGSYLIKGHDGRRFVGPFAAFDLSGPALPLHPPVKGATAPPSPTPAPAPQGFPGGSGELNMGAVLMLMMQQQAQAQAESTRLMGTIITAVLTKPPAPPPPPEDPLKGEMFRALIARGGSADDAGKTVDRVISAWEKGMGQGHEVAKIAAEAAQGPVAEPSAFDKALDSAAPVVLTKMMEKALG